jgi:hypothetical protein
MDLADGVSSEGSFVVLQASGFPKRPKLKNVGNAGNKMEIASSQGEVGTVVTLVLDDRFPIDFSVATVLVFLASEARARFIAPYLGSARHRAVIICSRTAKHSQEWLCHKEGAGLPGAVAACYKIRRAEARPLQGSEEVEFLRG